MNQAEILAQDAVNDAAKRCGAVFDYDKDTVCFSGSQLTAFAAALTGAKFLRERAQLEQEWNTLSALKEAAAPEVALPAERVEAVLRIWQQWDRGDTICAEDAMVMMRPFVEAWSNATPASQAERPETIWEAAELRAVTIDDLFYGIIEPAEPVALPVTDDEVDAALVECSLLNEVVTCEEMRRALEGFAKSRALAAKGQA